jgi:SET domain-containing protein
MATPTPARTSAPTIDPRHTRFRLRIASSPIHRWGVFAEEFIPKGHKVIEYTGERISRRETKKRGDRPHTYLFTLDAYWTIDGAVGGSGAEYINHSCQPNCRSAIVRGHILYLATRDIQPGEELTVDYRFPHDVERVPCGCATPACRGTINLKKEKPATMGRSTPRRAR